MAELAAALAPTRDVVIGKGSKTFSIPFQEQFLGLAPHGKMHQPAGFDGDWYQLPHQREEVKLMSNLGIWVPPPIGYHYKWPGEKPFKTQIRTAELMSMEPRAYVLSQFGTGKTRATLFAIDFLRKESEIERALVVAPLSTLNPVWYSECFRLFNHLNPVVLYGTRQRRLKLLADKDYGLYIINYDAFGIVRDELLAREDINCIVLDELAAYRNPGTDRFKFMRKVTPHKKFVWGLTGAPTPNAPTDAWAQAQLLTPHRAPTSFRRFRNQTMLQITQFKWVPKPEALGIVHDVMQPAVCYSRAESYTIPQTVFTNLEPPQSGPQKKFYKVMLDKLRVQYGEHDITAVNEGVKRGKLMQVSCGYLYDDKRRVLDLRPKGRLKAVAELYDEADGKVIVFVPYIHALQHVSEYLEKSGTVATVSGDTPKSARDRIFTEFQQSDAPQILVAHPRCMSHGLTLTAASMIIWYCPPDSLETYIQANARITRASQQNIPVVAHLASTAVERAAFKRLANNESLQGMLLDLFEIETKENDDE